MSNLAFEYDFEIDTDLFEVSVEQPSVEFEIEPPDATSVVVPVAGADGSNGDPGKDGQDGQTTFPEIPDLTLIFENGLV